MAELVLPSLGADMEGAKLVEWQVRPGDRVARGAVFAVVETVKGAIEVEATEEGVVDRLLVEPGAWLPVGAPMVALRGAGEAERAGAGAGAAGGERAGLVAPGGGAGAARLKISPAARRRASELGVDPAAAKGSGPDGAIAVADVEALAGAPAGQRRATGAAEKAPTAVAGEKPPTAVAAEKQSAAVAAEKQSAAVAGEKQSAAVAGEKPPVGATERRPAGADAAAAMRAAIASAMTRSKREIPHYYLSTEIDVGAAMAWLTTENVRLPVPQRLLPAALLLKATALALREVPELNGTFEDGAFRPASAIHLGVAIRLRQGGLIAPAIRDADRRPLGELMAALLDLVARARSGALRSSEVASGTITVTNLGELGVDTVLGVIYPPQVALVGLGRIRELPVVIRNYVEPRPVLSASLAADHRVSDGFHGARFLKTLERLLQEPARL